MSSRNPDWLARKVLKKHSCIYVQPPSVNAETLDRDAVLLKASSLDQPEPVFMLTFLEWPASGVPVSKHTTNSGSSSLNVLYLIHALARLLLFPRQSLLGHSG